MNQRELEQTPYFQSLSHVFSQPNSLGAYFKPETADLGYFPHILPLLHAHLQLLMQEAPSEPATTESGPKGYLLLHNISKKNNVGNIIRSACAFGLSKVLFISNRPQSKKMKILKEFKMFGNQGTYKEIEYEPFLSLEECKEELNKRGIRICGVEIGEGSLPIQSQPFTGSTAFFLGNEGTGMLPVHKKLCDFFVYIPQYTEKTASLNVAVAAGIIFHHFAMWAGFKEAKVYGEKYQNQLTEGAQEKEKQEPSKQKSDEEQQENQRAQDHTTQVQVKKQEKAIQSGLKGTSNE